MAYTWDVFQSLCLMIEISEEETEVAKTICEISLKEVLARVRPDVDIFDPRINSAAAAQALYSLCIKRLSCEEVTGLSSFKAGDLSVAYDDKGSRRQLELAKEILAKAMENLTPLLIDNGFYVGKVDVYDKK